MEELLKQMKIDLEAFNNISNVTLPPEQQNTLKFDFGEDEVVLKIRKENNNMEELSKEELLDLMKSYNNYVMTFHEEHEDGMEPVSIYEYYTNEYQNNWLDDLFYELSGLANEECDEDEDEQFHQGYIAGLNHALAIIEERRDMYERRII